IPECHARGEVFERLLRVAAALPGGVRLVVLDAWRPFAVQQYLYDSLSSALAAHYPRAGEAELERLTRQFVSPPSSSREAPSPHLTGGAVDVTLCDAQGRWLDMGSAFDEAVPASYTAYFERLAEPDARQRRVRDHRRLLYHAMLDAGFSNLPSEWWHYDFGDQLWAWHTGATQALFGPVQLQAMDALWRQQLQKRPPAD
ncbi:M15 family metallopeptidase, partial [Pseudomonas aeruginosa]